MARITWQNVSGGDSKGAVAAVSAAGDTLNKGMDGLRGVVDDLKQQEIDSRTHAFKDYMASFNNPAELEAALQSGEVQEFSQRLGSLVDRDVVRDGADNRITSLYEQQDTDYLRGQSELAREALPYIDQMQQLYAAGDYEGAARIQAELQNLEGDHLIGDSMIALTNQRQKNELHAQTTDSNKQKIAQDKILLDALQEQERVDAQKKWMQDQYSELSFESQNIVKRNNALAAKVASEMFLPHSLDDNGLPRQDILENNPALLERWNKAVSGINFEPELTDTEKVQRIANAGVESGNVDPRIAHEFLATPSVLSSRPAPQGDEITKNNEEIQRIENEIADTLDSNPLLGETIVDAFNNESSLSKMVETIAPEGSTDKHIRGLRKAIGRLAAESMSNGEPIPAGVVLAYLMQNPDDRYWFNRWMNNEPGSDKKLMTEIHQFMGSTAGQKVIADHENMVALKSLYRHKSGNTYGVEIPGDPNADKKNALMKEVDNK